MAEKIKKPQFRYNKLKGLIKEHYDTQADFAKELGIATSTLTSRLKNETFFDQWEMQRAAKLFGIKTPEERDSIFFND